MADATADLRKSITKSAAVILQNFVLAKNSFEAHGRMQFYSRR